MLIENLYQNLYYYYRRWLALPLLHKSYQKFIVNLLLSLFSFKYTLNLLIPNENVLVILYLSDMLKMTEGVCSKAYLVIY